MLEGNSGLFSFTSHIFIHILAMHEPMPSRAHWLIEWIIWVWHCLRRVPCRVKLLIFSMSDVCGRILKTTIRFGPCDLLITKRSRGQWISRTFRCSSTIPRQTAYYRRLGRGSISLDDSISDAFSRMLHIFRNRMTTVHAAARRTKMLWELGRHAIRAQSVFKENVTSDVRCWIRYRTITRG